MKKSTARHPRGEVESICLASQVTSCSKLRVNISSASDK